jgi:drug/metabolite transporter (DMT)-like permease
VPRLSQRRALGALFAVLGLALAGVAVAAANHQVWVIAFAAGAIALWLGSLSWSLLRPR